VKGFFSAQKRKYNLEGAFAEFETTQKSKDIKPIELVSLMLVLSVHTSFNYL